MITRKEALEIMESFHSDSLRNMQEVDLAIAIAAGTGNASVSFFYPSKNSRRLKDKLRANKFYLETVTFASMPHQEHITVIWDSSIMESEERNVEVKE